MNYANRVKGNRPVGDKVFMQGGVCYNKAVPLAMASLMRFLERGVNAAKNSQAVAGSSVPTVRLKVNFCTHLVLFALYRYHHKDTKLTKVL